MRLLAPLLLASALAHAGSSVTIEIRGYVPPRSEWVAPDAGSASFGDDGATWQSNEGATTDYSEDGGFGFLTVSGP